MTLLTPVLTPCCAHLFPKDIGVHAHCTPEHILRDTKTVHGIFKNPLAPLSTHLVLAKMATTKPPASPKTPPRKPGRSERYRDGRYLEAMLTNSRAGIKLRPGPAGPTPAVLHLPSYQFLSRRKIWAACVWNLPPGGMPIDRGCL